MTWYAVYDVGSGALRSVSEVVVNPLPAPLASTPIAGPPDGTQRWNPATLAFEAIPQRRTDLRDKLAQLEADYQRWERIRVLAVARSAPAPDVAALAAARDAVIADLLVAVSAWRTAS